MPDFTEILSKNADDIKEPSPRPVGTYLAMVKGTPVQREVQPRDGGDPMPVLGFKYQLLSAQADVDSDKLSEHPSVSEWGTFTDDFFLHTEGGINFFKEWLVNVLGIEGSGKSLGQMVAEAPGKQLVVKLKHEPYVSKQTGKPVIGTKVESTAHV